MPQNNNNPHNNNPSNAYDYKMNTEGNSELFTMQDIDRISRELILPSLNMTKSSSFIPNTHYSPNMEGGAGVGG
jgi:hypothetical protein